MASKIIRGDDVQVVTGDHKGKIGKVLRVIKKGASVLVAGVNVRKKTIRDKVGKKVVNVEFPLHISNVMLIDRSTSKPSRVGFRICDDGVKKRFYKSSGEVVD